MQNFSAVDKANRNPLKFSLCLRDAIVYLEAVLSTFRNFLLFHPQNEIFTAGAIKLSETLPTHHMYLITYLNGDYAKQNRCGYLECSTINGLYTWNS